MFKIQNIYIIAFLVLFSQSSASACFCGSHYTGINNYGSTILTVPASTLPRGKFALGYSLNFQKYDEFNRARYRSLLRGGKDSYSVDSILSQSLNLAYGVTDDLDLLAIFPIQSFHKLNSTANNLRFVDGDSFGIGDFIFLAKYRFYRSKRSSAAVMLGIEIPSGDSSDNPNDASQIGSGSWDPLMGLSYSRVFDHFNFDSNVMYLLSTPGSQNITAGDNVSFNMGLSKYLNEGKLFNKKILPNKILGQNLDWTLITEMNGQWREKVEINGIKDPNQGGLVIFASTGLRMTINKRLSNSFYLSLPVIQHLPGNQSDLVFQIGFNTSLVF